MSPAKENGSSRAHNMNILFLFYKIDCHDGIASYCESLLDGLSKRKLRVFIASGAVNFNENTRVRRDAIQTNAVELRIYPRLRLIPRITEIINLARFVRAQNISVIHIHALSMLFWGQALSLLTGARL